MYVCKILKNDLQMDFCNMTCFYIEDGLGPEVVYGVRKRPLFQEKALVFYFYSWLSSIWDSFIRQSILYLNS